MVDSALAGVRVQPYLRWRPKPAPPPYQPPPPYYIDGEERVYRMNLLENGAMALAFDGDYDDSLSVGLEDEDAWLEYYLVGLAKQGEKADFESAISEHYREHLTTDERVWLEKQHGAIVETEEGRVDVYFYDNEKDLLEAWRDTVKHAEELQKEIEEEAVIEERRTRSRVKREIAMGRQAALEV